MLTAESCIFSRADAVASIGLGFVKRFVGRLEERFALLFVDRVGVSGRRVRDERSTGHADADRQRRGRQVVPRQHRGDGPHGLAKIAGDFLRLRGGAPGERDDELVAAVAAGDRVGRKMRGEGLRAPICAEVMIPSSIGASSRRPSTSTKETSQLLTTISR